ncbi:hypothetical protein HPB50_004896 [Hyalomma asiaticum]|uniref:Uncharacterized protein n=1 Tax=Hyalomma asiaticum TaxID=266040 RepID=A0ACB7SE60_HYAAI|nr:hypothetical protein HPB50_004896 [Hyalomma asiaticum]
MPIMEELLQGPHGPLQKQSPTDTEVLLVPLCMEKQLELPGPGVDAVLKQQTALAVVDLGLPWLLERRWDDVCERVDSLLAKELNLIHPPHLRVPYNIGDPDEQQGTDIPTLSCLDVNWLPFGLRTLHYADKVYEALKAALIHRVMPPESQWLQQFLHEPNLVDRTPNQLLRHMQQLLGDKVDGLDSLLVQEIFLQKIPPDIKMHDLSKLAKLAGKIMAVAPTSVAAITSKPSPHEQLQEMKNEISRLMDSVAALHTGRITRFCLLIASHARVPHNTLVAGAPTSAQRDEEIPSDTNEEESLDEGASDLPKATPAKRKADSQSHPKKPTKCHKMDVCIASATEFWKTFEPYRFVCFFGAKLL